MTIFMDGFQDRISIIFIVTEGVIMIPIVLGNCLLIICIKRHKTLHAKSYILIANLSMSDLLLGLVYIPYDMTFWYFPVLRENKFTCLLRNVLLLEFVGASVFNQLFLSVERYIAVAYPLWHLQLPRTWLICSITIPWIIATVIAVLPLFGWNSWNSTVKCSYKFKETLPVNYRLFCVALYFASIVATFILFIKVVRITFKILQKRNSETEINILRISTRSIQTSFEKTKLLILILGLFVLFWFPYGVVVVLDGLVSKRNQAIEEAKVYAGLLALLNSSTNWAIYGLKNNNIRRAFKITLFRKKIGNTQQTFSKIRNINTISL